MGWTGWSPVWTLRRRSLWVSSSAWLALVPWAAAWLALVPWVVVGAGVLGGGYSIRCRLPGSVAFSGRFRPVLAVRSMVLSGGSPIWWGLPQLGGS